MLTKQPRIVCPAILKAARGMACQLCLAGPDETVVMAHLNEGKGVAYKTSDTSVAALCASHHRAYDSGELGPSDFLRAYSRTIEALWRSGVIGLK